MRPPGVILAGGLSRRMGGGDKTLRRLADRPLLDHVTRRFRPQISELALNANGDPSRFAFSRLPVIGDGLADFPGPLAGMLAAMEWAAGLPSRPNYVATIPADAPFLPLDLVEKLGEARLTKNADIAVAASNGRRHPVVAVWALELAGELRRAMTDDKLRKVETFVDRHRAAVVEFTAEPRDPFFNINTEADLAEAERLLTTFGPDDPVAR